MEFLELIDKRQSCRDFSDKPIELNLIYDILEQAKKAPSACNSQPCRVFITNTADENEKMRKCLQEDGRNAFLDMATAFIAVYQAEKIFLAGGVENKFSSTHFAEYDIGEFIAYLTLAAKDKGIDSCIIGRVNNQKLNETFALKGKCDLVVALGYAKNDLTRDKKRKSLQEIVINYKKF